MLKNVPIKYSTWMTNNSLCKTVHLHPYYKLYYARKYKSCFCICCWDSMQVPRPKFGADLYPLDMTRSTFHLSQRCSGAWGGLAFWMPEGLEGILRPILPEPQNTSVCTLVESRGLACPDLRVCLALGTEPPQMCGGSTTIKMHWKLTSHVFCLLLSSRKWVDLEKII